VVLPVRVRDEVPTDAIRDTWGSQLGERPTLEGEAPCGNVLVIRNPSASGRTVGSLSASLAHNDPMK
jgi:hypothetical protein